MERGERIGRRRERTGLEEERKIGMEEKKGGMGCINEGKEGRREDGTRKEKGSRWK